ncbi:putative ferulic acid Esterase/Feruloyl esterase [Xylariaceae sp. FL0255]|nr:putative ferulic acid Esterase/Feruloyl esterase [Xylariaceae sp. FL0255]
MYNLNLIRSLVVGLSAWRVTAFSSAEYESQVASRCTALTFASILPANAQIERIDAVQAGSTYGDGVQDLNYPYQPTDLPALCAVTVQVTTSTSSAYRIGIFLPTTWNNRFLTVGNGGFGGGINWLDMGAGVQYGFAVVSTDTGHDSVSTDVSWALNNSESKTDWGWRAIHGSVTTGKQIVEAYYAKPISRSYYSGCSTGGRQGLKEVQISPESFDGVLVGSSAWYTSHLNPWATDVARYNWPNESNPIIDWPLLFAIAPEIVKQCDDIDGVVDGIVSLANECTVNYTALSCESAAANQSACLTADQAKTLQSVYGDWKTSSGEFLYTGLTPSSEGQMYLVLNYSDSSPYGIGYLQYFLLNNPSFSLADFNDSLVALADKLDPGNATAADYNLTAFQNRGGKMLMYHGMADGLVPMKGSNLYYENVVSAMGGNITATQEFFRYFMVPGMQHCWTTLVDAPWAFGGASQASIFGLDEWSVPGFKDAQHDILLALVDWVENNTAVDQVVATTWKVSTNTTSGVLRQRPLCPYPQMARWNGVDDVNAADSWDCGGSVFSPANASTTSTTITPTPTPTTTPTSTSSAHRSTRITWLGGMLLIAFLVMTVGLC